MPPYRQFCSYDTSKFDHNQIYRLSRTAYFSQLLSLNDQSLIRQTIRSHKANYRYKKLLVWDHLVSILYGVLTNCSSLREIHHGLEVCHGKVNTTISISNTSTQGSAVLNLGYYSFPERPRETTDVWPVKVD